MTRVPINRALRRSQWCGWPRIAELNDAFRRADPSVPGRRFLTAGVLAMLQQNSVEPFEITRIVAEFDVFTEANDPHAERDFGSFEYLGETCFWYINYFDPSYEMGSDDPSDTAKTHRVLTIMLAREW